MQVLQAHADPEADSSDIWIDGVLKREQLEVEETLRKEGYVGRDGFDKGVTRNGLICLERGWVRTDAYLRLRRDREREERWHDEIVGLQKEANELVRKANRSAVASSIAAVISALAAILALQFPRVIREVGENDYHDANANARCESYQADVCPQPFDSLENCINIIHNAQR